MTVATTQPAAISVRRAVVWTLVALGIAALLQLVVYRHDGGHALADVPGRFVAWRLRPGEFPYVDRGVEYPVVVGYLAWALATLTGSAARFFVANGMIDAALAVALTCLLRVRGGGRIWRWIAGPALVLFAFHNWDLLAIVPAIIGLYAFEARADRLAGASLALGASTKVFPGLFLPPLAVMRWHSGDRRGAAQLLIWAAGTTLVLNAPVALVNPAGWWYPASFQGRRPATWGTLWFWLFHVPDVRRFTIADPAQIVNLLAIVALVGSIAAITVFSVRRHLDAVAVGAAVTAAFLLTNKVYSPNYDLWIVPFFVLLPIARRHWLEFCVADLGVFILVYGRFHGLWSAQPVWRMLPIFIGLRAWSLFMVILTALRAPGEHDSRTSNDQEPHRVAHS